MSNIDRVKEEAKERYPMRSATDSRRSSAQFGFIAGRTVDVKQIDAVARELAHLEDGDEWPNNEQLGGNLTGTRDDEYRWAMQEQAEEILAAAGFIVRGGL